jgi:transposase InsO family protein
MSRAIWLIGWMDKQNIEHVRGAPFHPQTQGKIERWRQTLKNRILVTRRPRRSRRSV